MAKLKTNGNKITNFNVKIIKVESLHKKGYFFDIINLQITTDKGVFNYRIQKDDRFPDLLQIKNHIETSLQKAIDNFYNVEISEYSERDYLFYEVQSIGLNQYTGAQL